MGFILTALFLACAALFALFLLFANPENIERPILVGGLTLFTTLVSFALLFEENRLNFAGGTAAFVSICLVSMLGFGLGRFIDYMMGPADKSADDMEATLGADLAD